MNVKQVSNAQLLRFTLGVIVVTTIKILLSKEAFPSNDHIQTVGIAFALVAGFVLGNLSMRFPLLKGAKK